jgi:hypothetical protein
LPPSGIPTVAVVRATKLRRWLIVPVALVVGLGVGTTPAAAHQSGCHRWHSCPSDSGSYVCGDLGYTSGCPSETTFTTTTLRPTTSTTVRRPATTTTVLRTATSTTVRRPATTTTVLRTATTARASCHPSYTPCVPVASDVDCLGGGGNGPAYVRGPVRVIGPDVYRLDTDHDGIGCE